MSALQLSPLEAVSVGESFLSWVIIPFRPVAARNHILPITSIAAKHFGTTATTVSTAFVLEAAAPGEVSMASDRGALASLRVRISSCRLVQPYQEDLKSVASPGWH